MSNITKHHVLSSNSKIYKLKVSKCQNEINLLTSSESLFPVENTIDLDPVV